MEKASRWIIICILGYIGVVLTTISNKMSQFDLQNTEYAVLNEVKPQSFRGVEVSTASQVSTSALDYPPILAGLTIIGLIGIFMSWHLSRVYHAYQVSRRVLKKSYTVYREPIVDLRSPEPLHYDQDAIFEGPLPDGRINDSWLPSRAQKFYKNWWQREKL